MSELNYIPLEKLPVSQNFSELKKDGMAFIQTLSGTNWTNLNAADPGVTFLDELCYALTELGYCSSFPIQDLLTDKEGELVFENQFFHPQDILTTAPVTDDDFRKFLIDALDDVRNVWIESDISTTTGLRMQKVFLSLSTGANSSSVLNNAYYTLNKQRTLGTVTSVPEVCHAVKFQLTGTIYLSGKMTAEKFVQWASESTREYLFPSVFPIPYSAVVDWDESINTVFSGPFLKNGFITSEQLGTKKAQLNTVELSLLLKTIDGVDRTNQLAFLSVSDATPLSSKRIQVNSADMILLDWASSIRSGGLKLMLNGKEVLLDATEKQMESRTNSADRYNDQTGAVVPYPAGNFRDINSYYSIQETLPTAYNVGKDAIRSSDSKYTKGVAKQLKGYLALYDQVLANQFAQLSNLPQLFSFKNGTTGIPSQVEQFNAKKSKAEKAKSDYPIPFRAFSPTYFYQSIYNVPNIRPILKNYTTFDFSLKTGEENVLTQKSWKAYQDDPYNPYIKGLMDLMTDEKDNLKRRNDMLDHLLARHGESPLIFDELIKGTRLTGNPEKDQIILKSTYLQNFARLSYHRGRGYAYHFARKIEEEYSTIEIPYDTYSQNNATKDFLFSTEAFDKSQKIQNTDFDNFSFLELKMNLLFGLNALLEDFILDHRLEEDKKMQIAQVNWLIQERKGFVLLERALYAPNDLELPDVLIVFPNYISVLSDATFKLRLALFLEENAPVFISIKSLFLDEQAWDDLIPIYSKWYNGLIVSDPSNPSATPDITLSTYVKSILDV